jgi:ABC-type Fe3+-siderophore transport system permease subunit
MPRESRQSDRLIAHRSIPAEVYLTGGESLTIAQRIALILICGFTFAFGAILAVNAIAEFRERTRPAPGSLVFCFIALSMGAGGLINAFRFKRR